jgi:CBS domain-containing protein
VTALLVDGTRFVGVVHRMQLDDQLGDEQPAAALARRDVPTIEPEAPLADALAILDADDERRLVVLDPDGDRLRGLLCLTRDRGGFCQS